MPPPRAFAWLLECAVMQDARGDSIVGDLHEEWVSLSQSEANADRWYRREALWVSLACVRVRLRERFTGRVPASTPPQGYSTMDGITNDLRFAWRLLVTRPTISLVAIVTIALGIGAATAIFSVVDGVLLRPLPYQQPGQLVDLWRTFPDWRKEPAMAGAWDRVSLTLPELLDLRGRMRALSDAGAWRTSSSVRHTSAAADEVVVTHATSSLLSMLGVQPALGRRFLPGEDGPAAPRVAMITYDTWQRDYGAASTAVGSAVTLDSSTYHIIGVLPRSFRLVGERATTPVAYWIPAGLETWEMADNNRMFNAIGRVAPGATMEQVRVELEQLFQAHWNHKEPTGGRAVPTQAEVTAPVRAPLMLVLAASGLLLLITCGNVATLLLGEAARREQEMATRVSLGASRTRVARQLLTEHLVLALAGSSLGIVIAWGATHVLLSLAPPSVPRLNEVGMSARTLAFACGVAIATAVVFGLAPMLSLAGTTPSALVRSPGSRATRKRARLEQAGLSLQLALSVILLVGAALLARTLQRLNDVDLGFRPDNILFVRPNLPASRYATQDTRLAVMTRLRDEVRTIPGVKAVSMGSAVPFGDGPSGTSIQGERAGGQLFDSDGQFRIYDPSMTSTLGITVLEGRALGAGDTRTSARVMLVNEAMARRFWPTEPALGRRALIDKEWRTVVGVMRDVKHRRPDEETLATFYLPIEQSVRGWSLSLAVQVNGDPSAVAPAVRAAVTRIDPTIALSRIEPLTAIVHRSVGEYRFRAIVVAFFAAVAAVLSAAGVYGVTAGMVNRRVREMGIRMALGASAANVIRLVVQSVAAVAAAGAITGAVVALATAKVLAPFLYGVTSTDAPTFIAVLAALLTAVLIASYVPAVRVSRVQPASVMRAD